MMIDTHCHLNFSVFRNDIGDVLGRMKKEEVRGIVVGSQITTSQRAVEMAAQYPDQLYAAVALHPVHLFSMDIVEEGMPFTTRAEKFDTEAYRELAIKKQVVAIGECGIDYHQFPENTTDAECKKAQRELFLQHIALAREIDKPLIVHCRASAPEFRDAYKDLYEILQYASWPRVVIHAFATHKDVAKKFLDAGCMISFTGLITYLELKPLEDVVRYAPLDRMMVETDAPYMAPVPHRHERCEPIFVKEIISHIAKIKSVDAQQISEATTRNAENFFKINTDSKVSSPHQERV